ncbi:MAG: beta-lactamase family protein [Spirochaetaceae bacterium]
MNRQLLAVIILLIITGVTFPMQLSVDTVNGTTPSGIPFNKLENIIDEYAQEYIGKSTPGAAIAVIKDGEIIFSKGYGFKNIKTGEKINSESTIFEWASITKLFTWSSLMQLEERGLVKLNEDIRSYLPKEVVEALKDAKPITLLDLMNHTTGFGDYGFDLVFPTPVENYNLTQGFLKSHPEQFMEVGKTSAYSNHGAALAGLIIENVTGMTYSEYLEQNFLTPLNMTKSTSDPYFNVSAQIRYNKAMGYIPDGKGGFLEGPWTYTNNAPAGSLNGTIGDLARFAIALMPKQSKTAIFESNKTINRMFTTSYFNTAHGFFEFSGAKKGYGHGGNGIAFTSQFIIVPAENFAVITLTNVQGEMDLAFGIQELLTGKSGNIIDNSGKDLPDSSLVSGKYLPFRRPEGSYLELLSYLNPSVIQKTGENEITLNLSIYNQKYIQTSPYYYEIANGTGPLFNIMYPELKFEVEGTEVIQITAGRGLDLQPMKSTLRSLATLILFILSGITGFIVTLVMIIQSKKQELSYKRYNWLQLGFRLLGCCMLITNLMAISIFLTKRFMSFSEVKSLLLLNYAYLCLTSVFIIMSYILQKKFKLTTKQRVMDIIHIILNLMMLAELYNWNFFTIHM